MSIKMTHNVSSAAKAKPILNEALTGLECLRCAQHYELEDQQTDSGLGCKKCLQSELPVGLRCTYRNMHPPVADNTRRGMFRFAQNLPYLDFPSIGEGNTPFISLENLAVEMGVDAVSVKNEGQNPTGSHKDRMSPLAVARALSAGYKKVVASSSGNAGASLAAYAANAGMECCIIASTDISAPWAEAIKLSGAELRLVESKERWPLMQQMVQQEGWFPITNFHPQPVGSNPFGIEGYKTIAYEIVEQAASSPPTMVIVPTCRGDLLFGIFCGFTEALESGLITKMPKLVAAEPGKRLELVLNGSDYRSAFSIAANNMASIDGTTATFQSMKALQESGGMAVSIDSGEAIAAQRTLAQHGLYAEMSSAAAMAALQRLKQLGKLSASERVALILTSHGYKETPKTPAPIQTRACN